jgi:membrane protein
VGALSDLRDKATETSRELAGHARVGPFIDHGKEYAESAQRHRVTGLAAEVAFYAVLSIFPAILALAAALGSIDTLIGEDAAARVREGLVEAIEGALGSDAGPIVAAIEALFEEPSAGLFGIGVVLATYTASRGFNALIKALDVVYEVPETRGMVKTRGLALLLAGGSLLVGAVVLAMVVLGPLFGAGARVAEETGAGDLFITLWTWARPPVLVLALTAWAATMFHLAPNHTTPWRNDLPGAVVTMTLWLLGATGFRIYLEFASDDTNALLGALGGALTLLLWLYVMGLALLLGAEVNALLARRRRRRAAVSEAAG